jgi:hypothetical protein
MFSNGHSVFDLCPLFKYAQIVLLLFTSTTSEIKCYLDLMVPNSRSTPTRVCMCPLLYASSAAQLGFCTGVSRYGRRGYPLSPSTWPDVPSRSMSRSPLPSNMRASWVRPGHRAES